VVRADGRVYWDYRVCGWVDSRSDRPASAPSADKTDDDKGHHLADALPRQPGRLKPGPLEPARLEPARLEPAPLPQAPRA